MADNKIQRENSGSEAEMSQDFAARRTVIRGMVSAIPVILTVSSGEALANASNLQCIQQPPSLAPQECIDTSDRSVRVWQRYDTTRKVAVDYGSTEEEGGGKSKKGKEDGEGPADDVLVEYEDVPTQCLLYADESGEIFTSSGPGLNPFTTSCYASFI